MKQTNSIMISFLALLAVILIAFITLDVGSVFRYLADIYPCNYLLKSYWDKPIDFWFYCVLILDVGFFLGVGTFVDYLLHKYVGNMVLRLVSIMALQIFILCLLYYFGTLDS